MIAGLGDENDNQLMVERLPRPTAAPDPDKYKSFSDWLKASTEPWGYRAAVARYAGVSAQAAQKWKGKDVPKPPVLKLVAEWAGVGYESLLRLADRTRGGPQLAAARNAAPRVDTDRVNKLLTDLRKELGDTVEVTLTPTGAATFTRSKRGRGTAR